MLSKQKKKNQGLSDVELLTSDLSLIPGVQLIVPWIEDDFPLCVVLSHVGNCFLVGKVIKFPRLDRH